MFDGTVKAEGILFFTLGCGTEGFLFCRLWHQLTLEVLDFVQDPCFAQGDGLIKVMTYQTAQTMLNIITNYYYSFLFTFNVCAPKDARRDLLELELQAVVSQLV